MFRKKEEVKKKSGAEFFVALILVILFLNHFHLLQGASALRSESVTTTAGTSTVPVISEYPSRAQWARKLLKGLHDPRNYATVSTVMLWMHREGGGFGNQAENNPLNVNPPADVPWPGHEAIGAWAFPNAHDGLEYTLITLDNPCYAGIRAALHQGDSAYAMRSAIVGSPWAQSHYEGAL